MRENETTLTEFPFEIQVALNSIKFHLQGVMVGATNCPIRQIVQVLQKAGVKIQIENGKVAIHE